MACHFYVYAVDFLQSGKLFDSIGMFIVVLKWAARVLHSSAFIIEVSTIRHNMSTNS